MEINDISMQENVDSDSQETVFINNLKRIVIILGNINNNTIGMKIESVRK